MKNLAALLLLLCAGSTLAQDPSAYLSRINVTDESESERNRALREGLMQVARYITGDARLMDTVQGRALLGRAGQLARSIGYGDDDQGQKQLIVDFDPAALDTALQQSGFPVFGVYSGNSADVTFTVSGLASPRDYARTVGHLRGQSGIKALSVLRSAGGTLELRARVEGGLPGLNQTLMNSSVLSRESGEQALAAYRLRP